MLAKVNSVDTNVYHVAGIKLVSLLVNAISGCQVRTDRGRVSFSDAGPFLTALLTSTSKDLIM